MTESGTLSLRCYQDLMDTKWLELPKSHKFICENTESYLMIWSYFRFFLKNEASQELLGVLCTIILMNTVLQNSGI